MRDAPLAPAEYQDGKIALTFSTLFNANSLSKFTSHGISPCTTPLISRKTLFFIFEADKNFFYKSSENPVRSSGQGILFSHSGRNP